MAVHLMCKVTRDAGDGGHAEANMCINVGQGLCSRASHEERKNTVIKAATAPQDLEEYLVDGYLQFKAEVCV
jgi:hypothetical protein